MSVGYQVLIFLLSIFYVCSLPFLREDELKCGYQACHAIDPNKLNVHLIPHSHDDVGWLKTVDQYYFGSRNNIQKAGVQYIITSVIEALKANPERKFIQVETAFFWKWWNRQTDETKQDVIKLVNDGQLEFINAAWSMNDEAATNYQSTIDQFTWGLRIINDTFGECSIPKIGWQIDPFGHSREQASIFAQLGFDGFFFARLDYKDKEKRRTDKDLELIWKGSANLDNTNVFVNIFPEELYFNLNGFCFDVTCGDTTMVDDVNSPDYNIPQRVDEFVGKVEKLAEGYQTKNLLIPMGGDFQYQAAEINFVNMDRLIKGFENHETVNVIYSTPSCYIKAVNDLAKENSIAFQQKTDDFFPYGSDEHCYWTGYFTSRPTAKRVERFTSNVLQAAKQLAAIAKKKGTDWDGDLDYVRQTVGVLQHHDAITGTAKQEVANDYTRQLTRAFKQGASVIANYIKTFLKKDDSTEVNLDLTICRLANVSYCETAKAKRFVYFVYNPLAWNINYNVRQSVPDVNFKITGPDGEISYDIFDAIDSFSYITGIEGTPNPKELVFNVDLPALGFKTFYYEQIDSKLAVKPQPKDILKFGTDTTNFEIDSETGLLKTVTINGKTVEITQNFYYYEGFNGNNDGNENRASGAYIFRPLENVAKAVSENIPTISYKIGDQSDEVHQTFNEWIKQIIRVYKNDNHNYIEFDWIVGPIPVDEENSIGKEIITRFNVKDLTNSGVFYTDSNGRELLQRELNKRPQFEYDSTLEPIASNYYPVTSKITIKDTEKQLQVSVLNDRAQGGASLEDGSIELMVHRRLLKDDNKGVGEALNEQEFGQGLVVRGTHYLIIGSTENDVEGLSTSAQERKLALEKLVAPIALGAKAEDDENSLENLQNSINFEDGHLQNTLPENVHLLTLEPWKDDSYILRLENILEQNEDADLSQTVSVDLTTLFKDFEIKEIRETTLGANQWLDEYEEKDKFEWTLKDGKKASYQNRNFKDLDLTKIELNPMQIRTFIITVA